MRIQLIASILLLTSCVPPSGRLTQEELRTVAHQAAEMGYSCATYQTTADGLVSDLVVGAPGVTPDGAVLCPGGRMFSYKLLEDEAFLESELECSFSGIVDLSEWVCIRGVPIRTSESSRRLDEMPSESRPIL